ncbi:hypothetical protein [Pygmaiobacter massiliensis]|uniref:hypothetical protein n=1 Tax=Pygmaiobacter massiliensis TaxID=1917873 RepID=UPI000C7E570E|nr:hypothetical protein [Pygmaiobacter massiliensis]
MGMPVIVPSNICRNQAITDLIQSVALEQAALAHIINAEGEKLQRFISCKSTDEETLLKVNKSVQDMLESVARVETILQAKLSLFDGCLCSEHDHCKDGCDSHK